MAGRSVDLSDQLVAAPITAALRTIVADPVLPAASTSRRTVTPLSCDASAA
jgi:hypothetical protein